MSARLPPPSRRRGRAVEDRPDAHYRWIVFAVLGLDGALLSFRCVWGATLSRHEATAWRLDARQLGILAAVGFLPYALMQAPGGYLTDRFGGQRIVSAALTATAAGTALFAVAPTFGIAVAARIVIGAGSALILLPSLAVLARWFRTREFATIQGAYLLLSSCGSLLATDSSPSACSRAVVVAYTDDGNGGHHPGQCGPFVGVRAE